MRIALTAAAILAALTLSQPLSAHASAGATNASQAVTSVAERLTGRQAVEVTGDVSAQPWDDGYADIQGGVIHIRGYLLDMLNRIAAGEYVQPYQAANAIFVFGHEARHVRGTLDEEVATRWSVAHAYAIARLLGASDGWAKQMRRWVAWWAEDR